MTAHPSSRSTLADVLAAVLAANLPPRRKQDMASAVRSVARIIERDPADISADLRTLSVKLRRSSHLSHGMTRARWHNIRSLLNAAFKLCGPVLPGRNEQPISEQWGLLYAQIETRGARIRLSRPLRWLSAEGILPATVRLQDLERYRDLLAELTLLKDPDRDWVIVSRVWNRCVARVPGWPQIRIHRESKSKTYSLDWSAFPPSLLEEVERWAAWTSGKDPFDSPRKPLAPVTIRGNRHHLQSFASALVLRGRDPMSLTSLADLVEIENYKEGLRFFAERLGRTITVHQKAFILKSIAKDWVKVDQATVEAMAKIVKKLDVPRVGLTQKNTDRLRLLRSPDIQRKLITLPLVLRDEVDKRRIGTWPARVVAQMAVALEILIMAPMRLKNLAALEIDRHIHIRPGSVLVTLPASEIKNDVDLTFELTGDSADLIRWYVGKQRSAEPGCRFLFPGEDGRHKSESALRQQIMANIRKYVGIVVNPHLFRHFLAYMHLKEHPGEYEIVRLCLGHKRMETTLKFYAGFETEAAVRHYDEQIMRLRKPIGETQ